MDGWRFFRKQGHLDEDVAIIVDGSASRSIKNVQVFGQISIQEPETLGVILEAVDYTLKSLERYSNPHKKTGRYSDSFVVFADNVGQISASTFGSESGRQQIAATIGQSSSGEDTFFTIINYQPYAAKQERLALPTGIVYAAWKDVRGKYGSQLATRFRYYTADAVPIVAAGATVTQPVGGGHLSFPAINIGQPGAFNSGASPVILKARRKAMRK